MNQNEQRAREIAGYHFNDYREFNSNSCKAFYSLKDEDCTCDYLRRVKIIIKALTTLERETVEHYSKWLEECGYIDSDWWAEEPRATDRYLTDRKLGKGGKVSKLKPSDKIYYGRLRNKVKEATSILISLNSWLAVGEPDLKTYERLQKYLKNAPNKS